MQRIEYTQKPMRVPDRGCAVKRRLELQRAVVTAAVLTVIALLLASAVVTGVRQAGTSAPKLSVPQNVIVVETK